jgi:ubiquinone/menaquinone biosynthesis C-methylase UbiE
MSDKNFWEPVWKKGRYSTDANRESKARIKLEAFQSMNSLQRHLGRVVEIGCGNSSFLKAALSSGVGISSYVGIDRSPTAIQRATANLAGASNTQFILADARALPLPNKSADTILSLGVIEHIEDVNVCLSELHRVAAPNAKILLVTSNTFSSMYLTRLIRQTVGAWEYGFQRNDSVESLRKLLNPWFSVRSMRTLHGESDFIFSTLIDRALGVVNPIFGRYVLCEAIVNPENHV